MGRSYNALRSVPELRQAMTPFQCIPSIGEVQKLQIIFCHFAGTQATEAEDGMITREEVAETLAAAEEATMATSSGASMKTTGTMTGATATALEAIEGATTTEGEGPGSSLSPGEDQIGAIKDVEVSSCQLCLPLDPYLWTLVCHCVRRRRQSAQLIYLRLLAAPPRGRGRDTQAGRQQQSRYDRPPQQRFDDQAKDVEFVGPALKGHESRITALLYDAASQQVSSCFSIKLLPLSCKVGPCAAQMKTFACNAAFNNHLHHLGNQQAS